MRRLNLFFAFLLLATPAFANNGAKDLVPTREVAITIATAIWTPFYGVEYIERYKPFTAILENGQRHVFGTMPKGIRGGGSPVATISKRDGRISNVHLAK